MMALPLATESQNGPAKTFSELGLQLTQTTQTAQAPGLPSQALFYQHSRRWREE